MSRISVVLDALTPFMLAHGAARGRVVRLSQVVDTILSRYPYPPAVATMLGELLLAASMLSANLKQEGILTLQLRGAGAVSLMVADAAHGNQLRGFAQVQQDAPFTEAMTPAQIMGAGSYLAITLDPGPGMQRYQGIVALEGQNIRDVLVHYFTQSQQLEVFLELVVEKDADGMWQAGGLMLERMAEEGGVSPQVQETAKENWNTAHALAATITRDELLDPLLVGDALLYRLFHEDGVWVYAPHLFNVGCRCSRERIQAMLTGMSLSDRTDMVVDGVIDVHCQFCNTSEIFTPQEIGLSIT